MTQRRLFIGAIALTIAMGGFLFVATTNSGVGADGETNAFNPDTCATPAVNKKKKECKNDRRIIAIVFSDTNNNGTQDEGEEFKEGISVTAKRGNANAIQKTTDGVGRAHFNDMTLGSYSVTVDASDSYLVSSKNPLPAKVVKGKIAFVTFGIKAGDGDGDTDPSPDPSTDPDVTPSPVAKASAYNFVSLPNAANKAYNTTYKDLEPFDGNILKLDELPDLAGSNKFFKSILAATSGAKNVRWDSYNLIHGKVSVPGRAKPAAPIKGKDGDINQNYVVSRCIAADEEQPMNWKDFGFTMKARTNGQLRVYYRVIDDCPDEDMAGGEWTRLDISAGFTGTGLGRNGINIGGIYDQLTNPQTTPAAAGGQNIFNNLGSIQLKAKNYKTAINKTGKYFQYKVNIKNPEVFIHTISLNAVPVSGSTATPSPRTSVTPTSSANPSATPSAGPAGEGKILIQTKKLIVAGDDDETETSPSPSGGPILPSGSPKAASPSPSADGNTVNPLCYGDQDTEEAANVPLPLIKQNRTGTGAIKIEDQQTNEDGEWFGLNEEEDNFPADTYQVTFGDFDSTEYKLVAFCDPDNTHLVRSQSDPTTKKATFTVKNGQTSRLIALYARRTLPYVSMNKYAIPGDIVSGVAQKILRIVYPGQKFNYLIRYTNTGGESAKDVVIRDVIPAEYDVDPTQADAPGSKLKLQPDPRGGTLVTATVGNLTVGQTGTIQIKVTLKADAFSGDNIDSTAGDGLLAPE